MAFKDAAIYANKLNSLLSNAYANVVPVAPCSLECHMQFGIQILTSTGLPNAFITSDDAVYARIQQLEIALTGSPR